MLNIFALRANFDLTQFSGFIFVDSIFGTAFLCVCVAKRIYLGFLGEHMQMRGRPDIEYLYLWKAI